MTRAWNRLSANFVRGAKERGRYADGGGLYLQVAKGGSAAWVFMYVRGGVSRAMGFGSTRSVPLALARELASAARENLARGVDPIDARRAALLDQQVARAKLTTFKVAAEQFLEANEARWRNEKHRREWRSAMNRFAHPVIGHLAVSAIDSGHVCKVLAPLVTAKPITAARLRGRIEIVLNFAIARRWRTDENPASKKVVGHLLPLRPEKANVVHQPAVPFDKVPALMQALRAIEGPDARLLEMIVLSVMRMEAVREARFPDEFDLTGRLWTIPRERMKTLGRDHRVPLTDRMVEIVEGLRATHEEGPFVFGGERPVEASDARGVLVNLLKIIGHTEHAVPHGFRSSFKDWAHEADPANVSTEVIERCLAHKVKGEVERAYLRSDLLERRKPLMGAWEDFCFGRTGAKVVKLRA
jgi:integrase